MGVAGAGKTTLGGMLAARLGWPFIDADDFHSAAAVGKMRSGCPLDDVDRLPWLRRLHAALHEYSESGESVVLACSALKESGRAILGQGLPDVRYVLLHGHPDVIRCRVETRQHFMPSELLASQVADLEPPADAVLVPIDIPTADQVALVRAELGV